MNDTERAEWVENDEPLYRWWKGERISLRKFVQQHRNELTEYINGKMNPRQPTGYHVP